MQTPSPNTSPPTGRRRLRRLAWTAGGLIALPVVLLLALLGLLSTEGGTRWAVGTAVEALPSVRLDKVEGTVLGRWSVTGLAVSDGQGVWLSADRLTLDWRPWALTSGRLRVERLEGRSVVVARLPQADGAPTAETGGSLDPRLLGRLSLHGLDVDSLSLGPAVLGTEEAVVLSARGSASGQEKSGLVGGFSITRLDKPGEAELTFDYRSDDDVAGDDTPGGRLTLDGAAFAPKGGALAGLLGLPGRPALRASLNGAGPVATWTGRLMAEAEGVAMVEADVAVRSDGAAPNRGMMEVSGTVAAGADAPLVLAVLARPEVRFAATLARDARAVRVTGFSIGAAGWSVSGQAALTDGNILAGRVTAQVMPTEGQPSTVVEALAGIPFGSGRVESVVSGTLSAPRLSATVTASDTVVRSLTAQAEASWGDTVSFQATGHVEGVAEEVPQLAPLTGAGLDVEVSGTAAADGSHLALSSVEVTGQAMRLTGQGEADLSPLRVSADLEAHIPSLSVLAPVTGLPLGGDARVTASLRSGAEGRTTGPVSMEIDDFALGQLEADRLIAGHLALGATVALDDSGLTVDALTLSTPGASAKGRWTLADWRTMDGTVHLQVPDLSRLDLGVTGAVSADAVLTGPVSDPVVTTQVALPEGSVQGVALREIAATVDATSKAVAVSALRGRIAGATVAGKVRIAVASGLMEGALQADLGNVDVPGPGVSFGGPARLTAVLAPEKGGQGLRLDLEATRPRLATAGLDARDLSAQVAMHDVFGAGRRGTFAVSLGRGGASGLAWEAVSLDGTLRGRVVTASATLSGASDISGATAPSLDASVEASADLGAVPLRLHVAALEVRGRGHRLALAVPTTVALRDGGGLSLDETRLAVDDAAASLAFDLGGGRVALSLEAKALPVDILALVRPDLPVTGHMDLRASLSGPLTGPTGAVMARSPDLALPEADVAGLSLDVTGAIGKGRLEVAAEAAGLGDQPARLHADLPLVFSGQGVPAVPGDGPLRASVDWQGAVEALWALVPQVGHRLSGKATLEARVEGTLDDPVFSGWGHLTDGVYENLEYGSVLRALEGTADLQRDGSIRLSVEANDGGAGHLSGQGTLSMTDAGERLRSHLTLTQATVVRRDDLKATLGGELSYDGTLTEGTLAGALQTYGAEVSLDGGLGAGGASSLTVVEVHRDALPPGAGRPAPEDGTDDGPAFGDDIALRVTVDSPGQIFVRGQGLDSEWQGRVTVRGTLSEPRLVGALRVVRGTYDLIGKSFVFQRGVIDLTGGERVNPGLDVRAEHTAEDLTAIVLVSGTADRPRIDLESQPALPRDEILARVLFGRGLADLGPAQAVGVARAASQLAGGGAGDALDITGRLRSSLGLDVLGFGGGSGGPSVEAGKYLTKDVYVGVEQGAGAQSGAVNVEVDLTPRVSVKSKTSVETGSEIGVEYKFDY